MNKLINGEKLKDTTKARHGKWMDMGDYCVCPFCWHTEHPQYDGEHHNPDFSTKCPYCGAKMKEE